MEDHQIIELYFARNEMAIQETDAKYGKLCLHIANNMIDIYEDAQECVNDTYMVAWDQIPPTRPHYFAAFLCKIVRNLSLKKLEYLHARKRNPHMSVSFEELENVLPDECVVHMETEYIGRVISDFLRTEKELSRKVFPRRYFFHDMVSDIAKQYGIQENTIKSMLFRTRNRLRTYLKKEGVSV